MEGTPSSGGDGAAAPEELWLTSAEQEAWRTFLYATTLLTDRLGEVLQSDPEIDLTLGEYEILVRLSEAERKFLRMSELADKVVHSRSRLTHTVGRMEKRGLVERVRCSEAGRPHPRALRACPPAGRHRSRRPARTGPDPGQDPRRGRPRRRRVSGRSPRGCTSRLIWRFGWYREAARSASVQCQSRREIRPMS